MNELGLNHGTSGNIGVRIGDRFLLTPSGMTAMNSSPIWAQVIARAMLVEPLEASTTVPPSLILPSRQAFSTI